MLETIIGSEHPVHILPETGLYRTENLACKFPIQRIVTFKNTYRPVNIVFIFLLCGAFFSIILQKIRIFAAFLAPLCLFGSIFNKS